MVAVENSGNSVADVIFVIEATANLGAYFDSLKGSYILPTLEYFNGGPADETDYGCDYGSTLYSLVYFMASDCAPEPSAVCNGPITSIQKLISWMDKIPFIGGAGEGCSHVAEGLATAVQFFDDLKNLRDPSITPQKYCILVCNSPPYQIPVVECHTYSGYTAEQLSALLGEKAINLSIISPRKIPALQKLYDKNFGELQVVPMKDYTVDPRHFVLLRGYHLQERSTSPLSEKDKLQIDKPPLSSNKSIGSPVTGATVLTVMQNPVSTHSVSQPQSNPSQRAGQPFGQSSTSLNQTSGGMLLGRTTVPTTQSLSHLSSLSSQSTQQGGKPVGGPNQPTSHSLYPQQNLNSGQPGNQWRPDQPGIGGVGPRLVWNQSQNPQQQITPPTSQSMGMGITRMPTSESQNPLLTPQSSTITSQSQLMKNQLIAQVTLHHSQQPSSQPNTQPSMLPTTMIPSQSQAMSSQASLMTSHSQVMTSQPSIITAANQMMSQSSMMPARPAPPVMAVQPQIISNPSQLIKASKPQSISGQQQSMMTPAASMITPPQIMPHSQTQIMSQSQPMGQLMQTGANTSNMPMQGQSGSFLGQPNKDRRLIWNGILEWQEKPKTASDPNAKLIRSLPCQVMSSNTSGEAEVKAENWPNKLLMQLIPQQMLTSLGALFKNSRTVSFHFGNDTEAMKSLSRVMSNGFAGCVHLSHSGGQCDIRVIMLLYSNKKKAYVGLIPNDQNGFVQAIRNVITNHKQAQQNKQRQQQQQASQQPQKLTNQPGQQAPPQSSFPQSVMNSSEVSTNQLGGGSQIVGAPTAYQLDQERQQNLLKIQQLQQTLEAAQQKEMQFKQQEQQKQALERQKQLLQQRQQQLQQQAQQLRQQQQQLLMHAQQMARPPNNQPGNIITGNIAQGMPSMGQNQLQGPQYMSDESALLEFLQ